MTRIPNTVSWESILGVLKSLKFLAQVERIDHNRQEATLELPQGRFSQDLILHIIQVRQFKVQSLENFAPNSDSRSFPTRLELLKYILYCMYGNEHSVKCEARGSQRDVVYLG
jgi:hypothetical protein